MLSNAPPAAHARRAAVALRRCSFSGDKKDWMVQVVRYIFTCFFISIAIAFAADAQEPSAKEISTVSAEAWANKNIGTIFEEGRITGAVISVVKDGQIIFAKGYGYGDVTTKAPASPDTTRVRIGSTTKTFTATIIAQLMEEGIIASLDDPANKYLKRYKLPDNEGVQITLRHLLTHTAGFEDKFFFIGSDRHVDIPVPAKLYDTLRPRFVRPAGEKVVYSNFGVATLGLVIEDISGKAINKVMEDRIFAPLAMNATDLVVTIDEPNGLAQPGDIDKAGRIAGPTEFTAINPAVAQTGSIVSTARDMAHYMNAQLGYSDTVSEGARNVLHNRIEENAPEISGLGMVFFVDQWAGRKTVGHGGNWAGFHTWMTFLPDERVGLFVTILGDVAAPDMMDMFVSAVAPDRAPPPSPVMLSASPLSSSFLYEFYGPKRDKPLVDDAALEDLNLYAGLYRADRRPFTFAEEISSLVYFGADVLKIEAKSDGLFLAGAGPWEPVGKGRFVLDAGARPIMVIEPNARTGALTLSPEIGVYTFTKIPRWASPKIHAILIHIFIPLTLIGLLAPWIIGRNIAAAAPLISGVAGIVLLAAAIVGAQDGQSMMVGYFAGYLGRIGAFVAGANLLALSCFVAAFQAIVHGKSRLRVLLLILPALAATIILGQYNALGFQLI